MVNGELITGYSIMNKRSAGALRCLLSVMGYLVIQSSNRHYPGPTLINSNCAFSGWIFFLGELICFLICKDSENDLIFSVKEGKVRLT